jgi:Ca2+/Na+ antiporter
LIAQLKHSYQQNPFSLSLIPIFAKKLMDKLSFLEVIAAIALLYRFCLLYFLLTVKTERNWKTDYLLLSLS